MNSVCACLVHRLARCNIFFYFILAERVKFHVGFIKEAFLLAVTDYRDARENLMSPARKQPKHFASLRLRMRLAENFSVQCNYRIRADNNRIFILCRNRLRLLQCERHNNLLRLNIFGNGLNNISADHLKVISCKLHQFSASRRSGSKNYP